MNGRADVFVPCSKPNRPRESRKRIFCLATFFVTSRSRNLSRSLSCRLIVDSRYPIKPHAFDGISTYPLETRKSKVTVDMFGKAMEGSENMLGFISKLPRILAGDTCGLLFARCCMRTRQGSQLSGGSAVTLSRWGSARARLTSWTPGFVNGIAMNGSAAIHDFEVAFRGATSEEVEEQLTEGRFGMARETGEYMNAAVAEAQANGIGMGEGLGRFIAESGRRALVSNTRCRELNAQAYARNIR